VVRPADDARVVGGHVVGVEPRVLVRGALGGLDVGPLDAGVPDRGPVDRALVVGDVDAGDAGLRLGRARDGESGEGEDRGREHHEGGAEAASAAGSFSMGGEEVHTRLPACQEICHLGVGAWFGTETQYEDNLHKESSV
jgi:hypothetical protein